MAFQLSAARPPADIIHYVAFGLALAFVVVFGVAGIGRGGEAFADVKYWYLSASMWLNQTSPYDYESLKAFAAAAGIEQIERYSYPPTAFAVGLPLTVFPYEGAKIVWTIGNLIAIGAIGLWIKMQLAKSGTAHSKLLILAVYFVGVGSPFAAHVVWTGQTTLIVAAALIWAWHFNYRERRWLAGLLLAIGAIKPQLAILVGFGLLLDRQWRTLGTAAVFSMIFMAVPVLTSGLNVLPDWIASVTGYQQEPSKVLGVAYNTNVRSILYALGLVAAPFNLSVDLPIAIAAAVALRFTSNDARSDFYPLLLLGIALLFIAGRDYDYAACLPLAAAAAYFGTRQRFLLLGAAVVIFVPHRLIASLNVPLLGIVRPATFGFALGLIIAWLESLRRDPVTFARSQ